MAADNEVRMLSRAIRDRDITPLLERGVTTSWFHNDSAKKVFEFIQRHLVKYDEVPTATTVKDNFPTFDVLKVDDTIGYLVDQFVEYQRNLTVNEALRDAVQVYEQNNDHDGALAILRQGITQADALGAFDSGTSNYDLTDEPQERWDDYLSLKNGGGGLLGMATGFPTIDLATGGLQGGQLIVIIAPPKTGKSVLGLQIATHCHKNGAVPAFESFEMTNHEQTTRHDAFRSEIAHARLIRGTLEQWEEARLQKMLDELAKHKPFYLLDATRAMTVPSIMAQVDNLPEFPDLITIDGTYFIVDHITGEVNTPRAITNNTRALKNWAMKINRPVLITTQVLEWKMKGNKVTSSSIGYSSSFHQDADVILGLERSPDDDEKVRILKVVDARNCGRVEVELVWDWETGKFAEFEPEDEDDDV